MHCLPPEHEKFVLSSATKRYTQHIPAQETQPPTNRKRRFFYVEQASDEEEGTDHNFCPIQNHHSKDVL
jgi:hypothetical protein